MTQKITERRLAMAAVSSVAGGIVAWTIGQVDYLPIDQRDFILVSIQGAFAAGLLVAPIFGGTGFAAILRSLTGFALATFLGAMLATLMVPLQDYLDHLNVFGALMTWLYSAFLGPLFVLINLLGNGWVLLVWLLCALASHTLATAFQWGD